MKNSGKPADEFKQVSVRVVKTPDGLTEFYRNSIRLLSTTFSTTNAADNAFFIIFNQKK